MRVSRLPDPVAEQAAEWLVALTADDPARRERARAGYAAWLAQDPRHADAARRMEALLERIAPRPARTALQEAAKPRRRLVAAGLAASFGAALLAAVLVPRLAADPATLQAATGEWRSHVLADGSRITLNSNSALEVRFDDATRAVELVRGEVLVDVAHDAARPFVVRTAQGSVRALGTRFVVSRGDGTTEVAMLQSKTEVRAAAGGPPLALAAGEHARIEAGGVLRLGGVDPGSIADAWRLHQLVVRDRPLAQVLDELARHRPGVLRYDEEQIANLRVTAVLPLDDTDRALHLLLDTFPALRIRTVTPWLVLVDAPG